MCSQMYAISALLFVVFWFQVGDALQLSLQCNKRIVLGATQTCVVEVTEDNGERATGDFQYQWEDNAIPQHSKLVSSDSNNDTWSISYSRDKNYKFGLYIVRVSVCRWFLKNVICISDTSVGDFFTLTENLNGYLEIAQNRTTRNTFVATNSPVNHTVFVNASDRAYLNTAPTILSYWFVDCVYYGLNTDLSFVYNFSKPEEQHTVETLVVGDFTPLPPPPTTTTTTTTTTTAKPTTTTAAPTKPHKVSKRNAPSGNVNGTNNIKVWQNGTLVPYNGSFPMVCNSTYISTDPHKVYGYFRRTVITKDPISNVSVLGNYWLQHGELLSLTVNCKGSSRIQACYLFRQGLYNVTGNETCEEYDELDHCSFPIERYFQDQHTVIIIIKNDVNKVVSSVAVTVYNVKQQAQLSVIVVPVAFSLVAVVTIVFGVAYYLQNRSRFVVEVADFDFGPKYADMEYQTFKDRLKDSIMNAFTRDPIPSTSDGPSWPPGHKYGSMT